MLHAGQRRQEERRLLRGLRRLLGLVALLDDLEVEQRLPPAAGEERERDELSVELRRGDEDVLWCVIDGEGGQRVKCFLLSFALDRWQCHIGDILFNDTVE